MGSCFSSRVCWHYVYHIWAYVVGAVMVWPPGDFYFPKPGEWANWLQQFIG